MYSNYVAIACGPYPIANLCQSKETYICIIRNAVLFLWLNAHCLHYSPLASPPIPSLPFPSPHFPPIPPPSPQNMFQTLKYLALLGVPTFTAGNRLLRRIARARK